MCLYIRRGVQVRCKWERLADYTFYVYLLHTPVFIVLLRLIKVENELLEIVLVTFLTFFLALIISVLIVALKNRIKERRLRIYQ